MRRKIKKVAVLGSGIMGSAIACHLANVGMDVLLLDIVPFNLNKEEIKDPGLRNSIVNDSLKKAIKSKPSPLYTKSLSGHIKTGNFEDDLHRISDYDWLIEVIIEDLNIKKGFYEKIEKFRKPGTIVSSNTSGIPIHLLSEGRSDDFSKNFLGTHFFNPPRYLRLFEVIPGPKTDPDLVQFILEFARIYLGKQSVLCKDTPAFIANRIGIFSISKLMELSQKFDFDIETVDALTGPAIGRPKTGTYRLQDLIGIDVGEKVLKGVIANCPNDEYLSSKKEAGIPAYLDYLLKNNFLGNKSKQGFYKKTNEKDDLGGSIIQAFDLNTLEYREKRQVRMDSIKTAKKTDHLKGKILSFFEDIDEGSSFIQEYFLSLFQYVSKRIPEISHQIYSIDDAMKSGYAWDVGPFEYWDMIGVRHALEKASEHGYKVAPWVLEMLENGNNSFYKHEKGRHYVYDPAAKDYKIVPGTEKTIRLNTITDKILFKNSEASIYDIGEGVLCLEFTSKNNVIGEGTGEAMHKAMDIAESEGWKGIVIGNNAPNFTVGANLMLVAMLSFQKEWDKLGEMVAGFQNVNMRLRYSNIPVVTATQGYVFGGGVEMSMHADSVIAAAESYIGLVEAGVGLLPGGGGTKEFALRLSDTFYEGDIRVPKMAEMFKTIAMAEVATSAPMAFEQKYLLKGRDKVILNSPEVIFEAKRRVLQLADDYLPPSPKKIFVLGQSGLASLYTAINEFKLGKYISDHDALIAKKIAFVLCGGDLTAPQIVSEQYVLDLEREAFISLCGEQKTVDRIQYTLQFNKPLRN